mmetsp:Transcript_3899/g.12190  ORF Transcript_3899/g.12190 Transcript_3899/m.12190 type:complete len:246 (-) Transcript_3899:214-951(-)
MSSSLSSPLSSSSEPEPEPSVSKAAASSSPCASPGEFSERTGHDACVSPSPSAPSSSIPSISCRLLSSMAAVASRSTIIALRKASLVTEYICAAFVSFRASSSLSSTGLTTCARRRPFSVTRSRSGSAARWSSAPSSLSKLLSISNTSATVPTGKKPPGLLPSRSRSKAVAVTCSASVALPLSPAPMPYPRLSAARSRVTSLPTSLPPDLPSGRLSTQRSSASQCRGCSTNNPTSKRAPFSFAAR